MSPLSAITDSRSFLLGLCGLICIPTPLLAGVPDAFLPSPASNVNALVRQVNGSALVRHRYARFFRQPDTRVAEYLRTSVTIGRLNRAGEYTLYFAHPNGVIYPVRLTLSRGVRVFQTRQGRPLLVQETGCPLVPYHTAVEVVPGVSPPPVMETKPARQTIVPMRSQDTVVPVGTATPIFPTPPPPLPERP